MQALEVDRLNVEVLNNLGNLLAKSSKYESALEYLQRALDLNNKNANTLNNLANVNRLIGNLEVATKLVQEAITEDPELEIAYGTLAEIYAQQSNDEMFYKNLKIALSKGFQLDKFIDDAAYNEYRDSQKFKDIVSKHTSKTK